MLVLAHLIARENGACSVNGHKWTYLGRDLMRPRVRDTRWASKAADIMMKYCGLVSNGTVRSQLLGWGKNIEILVGAHLSTHAVSDPNRSRVMSFTRGKSGLEVATQQFYDPKSTLALYDATTIKAGISSCIWLRIFNVLFLDLYLVDWTVWSVGRGFRVILTRSRIWTRTPTSPLSLFTQLTSLTFLR